MLPTPSAERALAHRVSVIARALNEDFGVFATMHTLVRAVVETVPGALCAEVSLAAGGGTVHAPHGADRSHTHPNGQCCIGREVPAASRSCRLDLPLILGDRQIGELTLWCGHETSDHESDSEIGVILATHAALALHHAQRYEQLTAAQDSRDTIGQAKGMLMVRYALNAQQAFDMLRRLSMDGNRRVSDLAEQIVRGEGLPASAPRSGPGNSRSFPGPAAVPA